jgi:glutamyl/glutaminyl-tRNA synthetase
MIKNRLGQLTITSGLISFIIIALWASLFYIIKQDKEFVFNAGQSSQMNTVQANENFSLSQDKLDKLNQYFLNDKMIVQFIEELENTSKQAGVKLVIGQPDDKTTELKLNLSTLGTFTQTMKFLQSLENLPYASKVERVELRKGEPLWQSVFILRVLKDKK